jgi:hypothetical protein
MAQMNPGNTAGFPFGSVPPIGRVIEVVERYCTPSGQIRELRRVKETVQDSQGVLRTTEVTMVLPPLACSCVPRDLNDIAECSRCLSVVCASKHSSTCQGCGLVYCSACMAIVAVEEQQVRICKGCAEAATTPTWLKFFRGLIWGK